jgi:hypothetical protein
MFFPRLGAGLPLVVTPTAFPARSQSGYPCRAMPRPVTSKPTSLRESFFPKEGGLVELHDPAEPRFQGVGRLVDVVAIKRQARLEPQCIARAKPCGPEAKRCARVHEGAPELGRVVPRGEDFEAVFARVAGPRGGAVHRAQHDVREVKRFQGSEIRATDECRDLESARTLEGDQRRSIGRVLEGAVTNVRRDVGTDLCPVGCVANYQPLLGGPPVDDEIVQNRSALVATTRVERLAVGELRSVVRDQGIDGTPGPRSRQLELAHVRDVEDPSRPPHSLVLLDDAAVLHWHREARERDHAAVEGDVLVVEGGLRERGVGDGLVHSNVGIKAATESRPAAAQLATWASVPTFRATDDRTAHRRLGRRTPSG